MFLIYRCCKIIFSYSIKRTETETTLRPLMSSIIQAIRRNLGPLWERWCCCLESCSTGRVFPAPQLPSSSGDTSNSHQNRFHELRSLTFTTWLTNSWVVYYRNNCTCGLESTNFRKLHNKKKPIHPHLPLVVSTINKALRALQRVEGERCPYPKDPLITNYVNNMTNCLTS